MILSLRLCLSLLLLHLSRSQTPTPSPTTVCLSEPAELPWYVVDETQPFLNSIYAGSIAFDACTLSIPGTGVTLTTRLFDCMLPAPTLRVVRGNEYRLSVANQLGPESAQNPTEDNVFKDPNTTNIHTHGPHISGQSPGDNVFISISPGESHTYQYLFPCDHSGGTFWYHSHHHGSTAAHVGGGAAGMLIIDDDQDMEALPTWYADMREFLLMMLFVNLPAVDEIFNSTVDSVFSYNSDAEVTAFYLLNGVYQPTLCMNSGEWLRLRIVHANPWLPGYFRIAEPGCTFKLLARDGVIVRGLNDADVPRDIDAEIFLTQSSRADIAVSCNGSPAGTATYTIEYHPDFEAGGNGLEVTTVVGYIEVAGTDTAPPSALTPFSPARPPYMVDMLSTSPSAVNNLSIDMSNTAINGIQFDGERAYMADFDPGDVIQFLIDNDFLHVLHVHVNHMQVISTQTPVPFGFQEPGDWLDTIYKGGVVRYVADTWGGTIVLHCHILGHEDRGVMDTIRINGGCDWDYTDLRARAGVCNANFSLCSSSPTPTPTSTATVATVSAAAVATPTLIDIWSKQFEAGVLFGALCGVVALLVLISCGLVVAVVMLRGKRSKRAYDRLPTTTTVTEEFASVVEQGSLATPVAKRNKSDSAV